MIWSSMKKMFQYCLFRLRGQTSRRRPEGAEGQKHGTGDWHRCHFGLNFRKFHKGDDNYDLDGVHRINLKYAKEDPSYIREKYCFDDSTSRWKVMLFQYIWASI